MPNTVDSNIPAIPPTGLELLRALWLEIMDEPSPDINDGIDELINCNVVSIRYALITQLLGKLVDSRRDVLSIQLGDANTAEAVGRWDARSFCQTDVVPWVREAGQVLGTSPDPYVNNPLRRPRLDAGDESLRSRQLWDKLVAVLRTVQKTDEPEYTEAQLRLCLVSLAKLYNQLSVQFDVPQRISLESTVNVIGRYTSSPSGGERPQIVIAALMRTIGEVFGIFDEVVRQAINEADAASASPGDVICYESGEQILAVEVKDRSITLDDVDTAILKARRSNVTEFLFATVPSATDDAEMLERTEREFGLGINVYQSRIETLLRVLLAIAGESSRSRFLALVGEELNDRVTQPAHKLAWQELLHNL